MFGFNKKFYSVFDNNVDAFIPELWANESLMILVENMVAASLVYRDFENVIAKFGDVVNTRRPADFVAVRKTDTDNVTIQDAVAVNVPVPLDQHPHTSFLIRDGEESKSFKELVDEFLYPATLSIARFLDVMVLSQYVQFLGNVSGNLGNFTSSNGKDGILDLRQKFNTNKAPFTNRNMILNPTTESTLLKIDLFVSAQTVGDKGEALANASLGRKLGWDMYMDQNMAVVAAGNTTVTGAVNLSAGYPAGTTTVVVDGLSAAITAGTYMTVGGADNPVRVVSTVGGATPTSITFTPGLAHAVLDNAVITLYTPGAVNNSGGYAAGYAKEITVSGFSVAPQIGQAVTFGLLTTSPVYTIIAVTSTTGITLDRPLAVAIANSDKVNIGPAGNYNFAYHPNAMALVVRPLAAPRAGTGALSAVVNWNNLSMRSTITYDGNKQGHLVTLDMLCGIAVLDTRLGGVLLG